CREGGTDAQVPFDSRGLRPGGVRYGAAADHDTTRFQVRVRLHLIRRSPISRLLSRGRPARPPLVRCFGISGPLINGSLARGSPADGLLVDGSLLEGSLVNGFVITGAVVRAVGFDRRHLAD